jgi:hypothetical protein
MQIEQLESAMAEAAERAERSANEGLPVRAREWANAAEAAADALTAVQAAEKLKLEREQLLAKLDRERASGGDRG